MSVLRQIARRSFFMGGLVSKQPEARLFSMTGASYVEGSDELRAKAQKEPQKMTTDEWRAILNPKVFNVARERGTERAFTSPLYDNHDKGIYECACCSSKLFTSETKFDSGTGWPSFFDTAETASIDKKTDKSHGMNRTEVTCKKCDAHLGHLFNDGPRPTGLRYCINGVTLKFVPKSDL